MIKAKDIMTKDVVTLTPDAEITKAAKLLLEKGFNALPVVDKDGRVVGILCQSDLISQQEALPVPSYFTLLDSFIPLTSLKKMEREVQKIAATTVQEAMTPEPVSVGPDTDIEQIAALMVDKGFHTLPVMEDGKLLGIVGKEDILRTLVTGD
ncbi:MAG: CBS domain-containing protein [Desulfarculaceae bacterium]|nr:CBS domain-containing protein [Desulfarculaceae bacterium]MCF8048237.1 CBS domain-containing protein [Desulfarculaceae bacterium]MCF8098930.1 CBS domain-containing protein [Desulfarculaceae bacterium]MCF8122824.1 CBS domain-containing protein [Desulfarculaceae bacterium]